MNDEYFDADEHFDMCLGTRSVARCDLGNVRDRLPESCASARAIALLFRLDCRLQMLVNY